MTIDDTEVTMVGGSFALGFDAGPETTIELAFQGEWLKTNVYPLVQYNSCGETAQRGRGRGGGNALFFCKVNFVWSLLCLGIIPTHASRLRWYVSPPPLPPLLVQEPYLRCPFCRHDASAPLSCCETPAAEDRFMLCVRVCMCTACVLYVCVLGGHRKS